MIHTLFLSAFKQACSVKGCPFCTLAQQTTRRYLSTLLHEYTLAPDIHRRLAQARGLCNAHAWLLQYVAHAEQKDGVGVAILYGSVLTRLQEDLQACLAEHRPAVRHREQPGGRSAFAAASRRRLRAERTCLACEHQADSEQFALAQFLEHLDETNGEGELALRYRQSTGACLPHLLALLEQAPGDSTARWLVEVQRDKIARLADELETYVRKHEVHYKDQPMGPERDSWVRVIEQTAGKRAVPLCRPERG